MHLHDLDNSNDRLAMQLVPISSIDDDRIRPYRGLPQSDPERFSRFFVVEGRWLVERLVASDFDVESILVDERHLDFVPPELSARVPVYAAAPGLLDEIVGFHFHRGILACGIRKPKLKLPEAVQAGTAPATIVVCSGVQDPTNLGGILRNCIAFGIDTVILGPPCADPFARRVLRVSMGAVLKMKLVSSAHLAVDLVALRDSLHFELVASVLGDEAESITAATRGKRLALLFGNEGYGLEDDVTRLCQRKVTIPMCHGTDSLNAAVASGVFLYHFTRIAATND